MEPTKARRIVTRVYTLGDQVSIVLGNVTDQAACGAVLAAAADAARNGADFSARVIDIEEHKQLLYVEVGFSRAPDGSASSGPYCAVCGCSENDPCESGIAEDRDSAEEGDQETCGWRSSGAYPLTCTFCAEKEAKS